MLFVAKKKKNNAGSVAKVFPFNDDDDDDDVIWNYCRNTYQSSATDIVE